MAKAIGGPTMATGSPGNPVGGAPGNASGKDAPDASAKGNPKAAVLTTFPPLQPQPPLALASGDFTDRGACPLCGSVGEASFETVYNFDVVPVRRCRDCGLIHSARIMSDAGTAKYYQDVFGSEFHKRGQMINADVNLAALKKMLPMREIITFLDVGCGYGFLPWLLKSIGVKPMGVEISRGEAQHAKDYLNIDVRTGTLEDAGMPTNWFDAAACFEVIEHIPRPVQFLKKLAEHIRPNGYIIVGTDNFESPVVQRMGARYPKWIPHTHVNHFGPDTLAETIRRAGLKVESIWSYTPPENSVRSRLPKYRKPIDAKLAWNFSKHIKEEMGRNYPMFWLRNELAKIWSGKVTLGKNGKGSMMFAVARPRS